MKKITVFTPTYNRGYIIEKLYKSLKEQTIKDFEWVIVDDGSTDNTKEIVSKFDEDDFKINYHLKVNGGKHTAINYGLDIAKGEYFFIVDSDDSLLPNSIERIIYWIETIKNKEGFVGVSGLRGYNSSDIIGKTFSGEFIDCTTLERNKYNIIGDKAEVFRTEILKKYKFPVVEGERFFSEAFIWNKLALDGYKIRWFNEIVYICNYLDDGLTKNSKKIFESSPIGMLMYLEQLISLNDKNKLKYMVSYYEYSKQINQVNEMKNKFKIKDINIIILKMLSFVKRIIKR